MNTIPVTGPITNIPPVHILTVTCICCWYRLHPTAEYPKNWSSTLCIEHRDWYKQRKKSQAGEA